MSKVVKLSSVMEREEKLKEIYEGLEVIKDQLTALIDEYEEEEKAFGKKACVYRYCALFCSGGGNRRNLYADELSEIRAAG